MSSHPSNTTAILFTSLLLSVLVISLFFKIMQGLLLLITCLVAVPVVYLLVKGLWHTRKRSDRPNKLKERA